MWFSPGFDTSFLEVTVSILVTVLRATTKYNLLSITSILGKMVFFWSIFTAFKSCHNSESCAVKVLVTVSEDWKAKAFRKMNRCSQRQTCIFQLWTTFSSWCYRMQYCVKQVVLWCTIAMLGCYTKENATAATPTVRNYKMSDIS